MKQHWRRLKTQLTEWSGYPGIAYDLAARSRRFSQEGERQRRKGVIVSFTSMPSRLTGLHLTVRSLMLQSVLPEKIVLYLGSDEMAGVALPDKVARLCSDLFEIRYCDKTLGSYDKLVHALKDFEGKAIVTCDDDKVYPRDWLAGLVEAHENEPDVIHCHLGRKLPLRKAHPFPAYLNWPAVRSFEKGNDILALGVGGVLYPAGCLHGECTDHHLFTKLAPKADDLWFKLMALRAQSQVRCTGHYKVHPPSRPTPWQTRLANKNVYKDANVEAFARLMAVYGDELESKGLIAK